MMEFMAGLGLEQNPIAGGFTGPQSGVSGGNASSGGVHLGSFNSGGINPGLLLLGGLALASVLLVRK